MLSASTVQLSATRPLAPVGVSTNMVLNSPIPEPEENLTVVCNLSSLLIVILIEKLIVPVSIMAKNSNNNKVGSDVTDQEEDGDDIEEEGSAEKPFDF